MTLIPWELSKSVRHLLEQQGIHASDKAIETAVTHTFLTSPLIWGKSPPLGPTVQGRLLNLIMSASQNSVGKALLWRSVSTAFLATAFVSQKALVYLYQRFQPDSQAQHAQNLQNLQAVNQDTIGIIERNNEVEKLIKLFISDYTPLLQQAHSQADHAIEDARRRYHQIAVQRDSCLQIDMIKFIAALHQWTQRITETFQACRINTPLFLGLLRDQNSVATEVRQAEAKLVEAQKAYSLSVKEIEELARQIQAAGLQKDAEFDELFQLLKKLEHK